MDDSVFLRSRNEMEDEAWGQGITGGGPGTDSFSHRAFTTGRRKGLPQQQVQLAGHHPHTSRKVRIRNFDELYCFMSCKMAYNLIIICTATTAGLSTSWQIESQGFRQCG